MLPKSVSVSNNGHTFVLRMNFAEKVLLEGGPLKGSYVVESIHWHWGNTDDAGSEHVMDGKRYSAEMHIVAYNMKFGKLFKAIDRARKPNF